MKGSYWHGMGGGAVLIAVAMTAGCRARRQQPSVRVDISNVDALRSAFGGTDKGTAAVKAAIPDPVGWATLKGSFKIDGPAPARKPQKVEKDLEVCAPGGRPVLGEEIVIDSATNGIKDVVIYLVGPHAKFPVGDPKWEHPSYIAKKDEIPNFDQKQCVFLTHVMALRSSQKLKVLNSDPVGHNTNINAPSIGEAKVENMTVPANSFAMYVPGGESPQPFPVVCNVHNWMGSHMITRDSPYFAVTKPDGTFEIPYIPAGVELEFRVWQEKSKFLQEVTLNGKPATWPQGKVKITAPADGATVTLDVVVKSDKFNK